MTVRIAYVEEPPFYWTDDSGSATGADIELAKAVLGVIGEPIEFVPVTFEELLPGVAAGRWEMNVPIFVTAARAQDVAFSVPVWSLGDGFVVFSGNPKALTSYAAVVAREDARLGLIPGQVQFEAAVAAGVTDDRIVSFTNQADAVAALLSGDIDAFAATAVGNRVIVEANPELEAVDLEGNDGTAPVGAFSFGKNPGLVEAVNAQLRAYLGSPDHRERMARFGITANEIDGVVGG